MAKEGINLNGETRDFLERFYKLEQASETDRDDMKEIKTDLKEIKEALIPLANKVYFHDKMITGMGILGGILLTGCLALLKMVIG